MGFPIGFTTVNSPGTGGGPRGALPGVLTGAAAPRRRHVPQPAGLQRGDGPSAETLGRSGPGGSDGPTMEEFAPPKKQGESHEISRKIGG